MGRCKQKTFHYCVDDAMIQTIGYKKEKKLQHNVLYKDAGAECPRNKVMRACTDPFEHYPTHPEGRRSVKRKKSTCLVSMQGDSNNQRNLFKCSKRRQRDTDIEPELKHYRHTGDIDDIKMQKNIIKKSHHNAGVLSDDKKYKNNKTYPRELQCLCLGKIIYTDTKAQTEGMRKKNKKTEIVSNKRGMKESLNDNESENRKTDIKLELKPKHTKSRKSKQLDNSKQKTKMSCLCTTEDHGFTEGPTLHNICARDICEEAFKKRQIDSVYKREKTNTLENIAQSKSNIGVENIRNKLSCICRKYSQKILPNRTSIPEYPAKPIPEDGVSENGNYEVSKMNKKGYLPCRYSRKPKITECTNEICEPTELEMISLKSQTTTKHKVNFASADSCEPECPKLCFKDRIKSKLKLRRTSEISEHINTTPRNACDQTGEPFIEIKVDTVDMCVLDPVEIKNRVLDLSKNYNGKPTCICRSHKKRREEFLDKNLCGGGICHKTFKDKKTNFKCKCVRGGECSDLTCGGNNIYCSEQQGCDCNSIPVKSKEPLFEVKLDSKRMCVLNSDEIHQKIIDIEREAIDRANEDCPGGICGIARAGNRDRFKCRCVEKKRKPEEIAECSENTCSEYGAKYPENKHADLVYYWLTKLYNRGKQMHRSKMTRKAINTNEVGNIKSIFSSIRDQIKSTPEIWTGSPPKRQKRQTRNVRINSTNLYRMPTREGLKLDVTKNHLDTCTCTACTTAANTANTIQDPSLLYKCKSFLSCSLSALKNRHKYTVNKTNGNFHRRNGLSVPPQRQRHTQYSSNTVDLSQGTDLPEDIQENGKEPKNDTKKKNDNLCACDNTCECADAMEKEKEKEKLKKIGRKKPQDDRKHKLKSKLKRREEEEKHKQYSEADKKYQKRLEKKQKIEIKKRIKQYKLEEKEMKELSKQDEARETNCLVDFILGFLRLAFIALKGTISVLYKVVSDPQGSYRYTKLKCRFPKTTIEEFLRWADEAWIHQKFRMNKAIKGSRTMCILKDEVKESDMYQAFAPKGKTDAERRFIEASNKRRKKRILKRQNEAIFGCRHMLLVTLRKTPCLWFYHICPNIYPQFLSARAFLINFGQMLMFCLAVMVWTPCIACCEACRGLVCCMLCTQ